MSTAGLQTEIYNVFRKATRFLSGPPKTEKPPYESRFDITDHGMLLPDIADFPECAEVDRFPSGTQEERSLHLKFANAFRTCDSSLFSEAMASLDQAVSSRFPLRPHQEPIKLQQLKNVSAMGNWYINYKSTWEANKRSDIASNDAFDALAADGVHASHIQTDRMCGILKGDIDELLNRKVDGVCRPGEGYDRSRIFPNNGDHDNLFSAIREELSRQGILAAAAKYHNANDLDFKHACLHICTPEDTHFTQTLQDCTTTSQLIGMHVDPKPVMKIIIYLNEVTEAAGPFCFVPGSHRWYFDETELLVAKGNSTGNYLHTPDHRQVALMFPARFRKNAIVGRFILDGTPLSHQLLRREVQYTSAIGNCLAFDPGNGFHRGGLCTTNNRINLQIVLSELTK